jgi:glycosyltransferase involved in cell wall biosynthesis
MHPLSVSIIIPALNEGLYLGSTVEAARAAFLPLPADQGANVEVLVVDNASDDDTAEVARRHGARVVFEPVRNVARARNAGARAAMGGILVFLDADTVVPSSFGARLAEWASDPTCLGGAFDTDQRPRRPVLRAYLALWRWIGLAFGVAQGAAQFCGRDAFEALGGYDERLFMGEDVDFYWRMKRLARRRGKRTVFVREVRVVPSPRRFDHWPVWKTLLWTNPMVVIGLRRWKAAWRGWLEAPPR